MTRGTWMTKDGRVLWFSEMSNDHILYSHRLVMETISRLNQDMDAGWSFLGTLQGEMAIDSVEKQLNSEQNGIYYLNDKAQELLEEIKERGLKPLPQRSGMSA